MLLLQFADQRHTELSALWVELYSVCESYDSADK